MLHVYYKCMITKTVLMQTLYRHKTVLEAAEALGIERRTIYRYFKKYHIDPQKTKFNHDFFESIDSEEKAYWLGFIMADGCVSDTQGYSLYLHLAEQDRCHLEAFQQAMSSRLSIHPTKHGSCYIRMHSQKLCEDLIALGCTPRKSLNLKYPRIRSDLDRHFIRGYFDGDGSISKHDNGGKGGTKISNHWKQFLFRST